MTDSKRFTTDDDRTWLAWLEQYANFTGRTVPETQLGLKKARKKLNRMRLDADGEHDAISFKLED